MHQGRLKARFEPGPVPFFYFLNSRLQSMVGRRGRNKGAHGEQKKCGVLYVYITKTKKKEERKKKKEKRKKKNSKTEKQKKEKEQKEKKKKNEHRPDPRNRKENNPK